MLESTVFPQILQLLILFLWKKAFWIILCHQKQLQDPLCVPEPFSLFAAQLFLCDSPFGEVLA